MQSAAAKMVSDMAERIHSTCILKIVPIQGAYFNV